MGTEKADFHPREEDSPAFKRVDQKAAMRLPLFLNVCFAKPKRSSSNRNENDSFKISIYNEGGFHHDRRRCGEEYTKSYCPYCREQVLRQSAGSPQQAEAVSQQQTEAVPPPKGSAAKVKSSQSHPYYRYADYERFGGLIILLLIGLILSVISALSDLNRINRIIDSSPYYETLGAGIHWLSFLVFLRMALCVVMIFLLFKRSQAFRAVYVATIAVSVAGYLLSVSLVQKVVKSYSLSIFPIIPLLLFVVFMFTSKRIDVYFRYFKIVSPPEPKATHTK
jgi:hypothetical protein